MVRGALAALLRIDGGFDVVAEAGEPGASDLERLGLGPVGDLEVETFPTLLARKAKVIGWVHDETPWQLGALFASPKTLTNAPLVTKLLEALVRADHRARAESADLRAWRLGAGAGLCAARGPR